MSYCPGPDPGLVTNYDPAWSFGKETLPRGIRWIHPIYPRFFFLQMIPEMDIFILTNIYSLKSS